MRSSQGRNLAYPHWQVAFSIEYRIYLISTSVAWKKYECRKLPFVLRGISEPRKHIFCSRRLVKLQNNNSDIWGGKGQIQSKTIFFTRVERRRNSGEKTLKLKGLAVAPIILTKNCCNNRERQNERMNETHSGLSLLQLLFQLLSVHLQHLVGFLESTESLHLLQLLLLLGESLCCSLRQGEKENTLKINNIKMNAFSCDSFVILFFKLLSTYHWRDK